MTYKTSQAADMAGISPTTVRVYTAAFGDFLSPQATPPKGQTRIYNDADIVILATIKDLKDQQKDDNTIAAALADGERVDFQKASREQEQDQDNDAGQRSEIVTRLTATVAKFEGELTATKEERDYLRDQLEEEREARLDAEKRATAAETELRVLRDLVDLQDATASPQDSQEQQRPGLLERLFGR